MIIQGSDVGVLMDPSFISELEGAEYEYHVNDGTTPGCRVPLRLTAHNVKVFVVMSTISPT
jgi:hypothetical protein